MKGMTERRAQLKTGPVALSVGGAAPSPDLAGSSAPPDLEAIS